MALATTGSTRGPRPLPDNALEKSERSLAGLEAEASIGKSRQAVGLTHLGWGVK
jgi:hypothetical protein